MDKTTNNPGSGLADIIARSFYETLQRESDALLALRDTIEIEQLEQLVQTMMACRGKVFVTGCGTSAQAARKIAHTLCCVRCPAVFLDPSDAVHGGMGAMAEDDILICLSKGGATAEMNALLHPARGVGARTVAITENVTSHLAERSHSFVQVGPIPEADDTGMLATSSTLAVIALFDSVAIAIARIRGFSSEQFATIHPGGAVGHKLDAHLNASKLHQQEDL